MAPILSRHRVVAAKHETTPGTAETLANADGAMVCHDITGPISEAEFVARELPGSLSPMAGVPGTDVGRCTLSVRAVGGATAPKWMDVFLPVCGWGKKTGQTFGPVSDVPEAAGALSKNMTIATDIKSGGPRRRLAGAAGAFTATFRSGQPVEFAFDFRGIWLAPSMTAALTPTYPTTAPLRGVGTGLTIGAWTPKIREIVLRSGGEVVARENTQTASGMSPFIVGGREVMVELLVEETPLATYDAHAVFAARTEAALAWAVGTAGNGLQFAAPKVQLAAAPQEQIDGAIKLMRLSYKCLANSSAGDDEFLITSI